MSKNYTLSILIPARNELFISRTVQNILDHKEGSTEIIVGLDGLWAEPGIPDHPDVRIVYVSESIGQRGMTNKLCQLSRSKYVIKCDAHCAFDQGFDVKLLAAIQGHDDWTVVPTMKNLHAFDWKCPQCGSRWYQGPTPTRCMKNIGSPGRGVTENSACGNTKGFTRDIVWQPRDKGPNGTSFRFDSEPHFQYFGEFKRRPEGQGDITPTMSLQGSFFMLTRKKYWELNICDEQFGSWGSQGIEVAVKTWLSGGQVMCVQTTWYAHMFRTQGLDFGFPYPISHKQVNHAKQTAKSLFFENKWKLQKYPLSWLLEKFWPIPGWSDEQLADIKRFDHAIAADKGIIYYTTNQLNTKLAHRVQDQLRGIGLPITSVSLKPMPHFGNNTHLDMKPGVFTMFKQILTALEASTSEIVFFCEHDVIYHQTHFDFTPLKKDMFYYNLNVWRVRPSDGLAVTWEANQVAELCCYREYALKFYRERVKEIETKGFNRSYEPGGRNKKLYENWRSEFPNIDVRHGENQTKSKWSPNDFRDKSTCVNWQETDIDYIPGWDNLRAIL